MMGIAPLTEPRLPLRLMLLATLLALSACSGPGVTSVVIEGGDRVLAVGDQVALAATVTGGPATVAWTSTAPVVASVDAAGVVTAHAIGTTTLRATSTVATSVRGEITVTVVLAGETQWTRQFGTGSDDRAYAVAIDATGRVLVAGTTSGALEGASAGGSDAFVRAYAADGTTALWTRQFGTAGADFANGLAIDGAGTVVVTGSTGGPLGGPHLGMEDAFVRAYDRDGLELWTRQFGTAQGDTGYAVATTRDQRLVVAGTTTGALEGSGFGSVDGFVRALDMAGNLLWTRQFGTPAADYAVGVAVTDDGRVLVAGHTAGDLANANAGDFDAFLRVYDADGDLLWTRQFGTPATDAAVGGVATDPLGRAFVAGRTLGALDGPQLGNGDAFLRAFDVGGDLLWGTQFGTAAYEQVGQVAADGSGFVFVAGETEGTLAGPSQGGSDAFVRKLTGDGATRWTRQFGTPASETAAAAATDGRIAVVGFTGGALGGPNAGSNDAFVRVVGP